MEIKVSKKILGLDFLLILIHLFFNVIFLPAGLSYTMIATPLLLVFLWKKNTKNVIGYFLLFLAPYFLIHLSLGIDWFYYLRSTVMVFTTYIFCYALYVYLSNNNVHQYFSLFVKFNLILFLIGGLFYFTPWLKAFWTVRNLTIEMLDFPRFQGFTYEPSIYSLLLAPIFIYYFVSFLLFESSRKTSLTYLIMLTIPLIFSFSFGVIGCLGLSFLILFFTRFSDLMQQKKVFYTVSFIGLLVVVSLFALLILYPDNPLYSRIVDLTQGKDSSASGRTTNALYLAFQIAEHKSLLFGVGFGQIKVVGAAIIREFYNYDVNDLSSIRIPNATGETIAMFGVSGFIFRLLVEAYLFVKTRVSQNYYRLSVFIFVFIYQFTGSFFHDTAQMAMWVIAFSPAFKHFDTNLIRKPLFLSFKRRLI